MPKQKHRAGIYRRDGSPYWWIDYTPRTGQRIRRSTKTIDRKEAELILANIKLQHRKYSEFGEHPARSFFDVVSEYRQAHKAKRSAQRDTFSLKNLHPFFQARPMDTLTGTDIRDYITQRLAAGVKPATINRELGLLSAAINYCVTTLDWQLPNPVHGRLLKADNNRNRWLTRQEVERLIIAAQAQPQAPHLVHFIELSLHTGLRKGEALGLEWKRVDIGHGVIHLNSADQKNRALSAVPLNDIARRVIVQRGKYHAAFCPSSPWVFCNAAGERIKDIKRSFATAAKRAGLDNVYPHDLRRTCGSWLAQAGVPIQQISALLRHSDISITHQRYAHLAPSNIAAAVAVLDDTVAAHSNKTAIKNLT